MARAYETKGKTYQVRLSVGVFRNLPSRAAAGMSATSRGQRVRDDKLTLLFHGTYDRLGRQARAVRVPCPCCGTRSAGTYALDPRAKPRLRRLRQALRERPRT